MVKQVLMVIKIILIYSHDHFKSSLPRFLNNHDENTFHGFKHSHEKPMKKVIKRKISHMTEGQDQTVKHRNLISAQFCIFKSRKSFGPKDHLIATTCFPLNS